MSACNRNIRQVLVAEDAAAREGRVRRGARETVTEELYNTPYNNVTTRRCCDSYRGCREIDARRHNSYWPAFAHPRWLTCTELNSRKICRRRLYSGLF